MPETAEVDTITIDAMKFVRSMRRTGDIRMIGAVQNPQVLGPTLQEAWVCIEDGKIEWRTVPIQWLSVADYLAETS